MLTLQISATNSRSNNIISIYSILNSTWWALDHCERFLHSLLNSFLLAVIQTWQVQAFIHIAQADIFI